MIVELPQKNTHVHRMTCRAANSLFRMMEIHAKLPILTIFGVTPPIWSVIHWCDRSSAYWSYHPPLPTPASQPAHTAGQASPCQPQANWELEAPLME